MELYQLYPGVRRAVHVEGQSPREMAREFALARKTVRKMLADPAPPGYQWQNRGDQNWVRGKWPSKMTLAPKWVSEIAEQFFTRACWALVRTL